MQHTLNLSCNLSGHYPLQSYVQNELKSLSYSLQVCVQNQLSTQPDAEESRLREGILEAVQDQDPQDL